MSKRILTLLAGGLLLASTAIAADSDYTLQEQVPVKKGVPQITNQSQVRTNARRFYSYQPPAVRGRQPKNITTFVRPATAKANGEY